MYVHYTSKLKIHTKGLNRFDRQGNTCRLNDVVNRLSTCMAKISQELDVLSEEKLKLLAQKFRKNTS